MRLARLALVCALPLALPRAPATAEPPQQGALPGSSATTIAYPVSNAHAGRIIGAGGGMITELRNAHRPAGVDIRVGGDKKDGERSVVFVAKPWALPDAIERARQDLVHRLSVSGGR